MNKTFLPIYIAKRLILVSYISAKHRSTRTKFGICIGCIGCIRCISISLFRKNNSYSYSQNSDDHEIHPRHSRPLTALIGYLNVLLEYLDYFKVSLAGHTKHLSWPRPCLASPWLRPRCKESIKGKNEDKQ